MLMAMYAVKWDKKAREERERQVDPEKARLARVLWSASEARRREERSWAEASTLKRLVSALGYTER